MALLRYWRRRFLTEMALMWTEEVTAPFASRPLTSTLSGEVTSSSVFVPVSSRCFARAANRAPQARSAASALSALVVQTAVNSTSVLACSAGRWERADQVPLTLAPISPSRTLSAMIASLLRNPRLSSGYLGPRSRLREHSSAVEADRPCFGEAPTRATFA
jgi:hypothetical protein